jgi:hypothetical protein
MYNESAIKKWAPHLPRSQICQRHRAITHCHLPRLPVIPSCTLKEVGYNTAHTSPKAGPLVREGNGYLTSLAGTIAQLYFAALSAQLTSAAPQVQEFLHRASRSILTWRDPISRSWTKLVGPTQPRAMQEEKVRNDRIANITDVGWRRRHQQPKQHWLMAGSLRGP